MNRKGLTVVEILVGVCIAGVISVVLAIAAGISYGIYHLLT